MRNLIVGAAFAALTVAGSANASTIFDDFNSSLGHFTSNVYNASGSDSNLANTSTSTLDTNPADALEGTGSDLITLNATSTTASARLRDLSGGGTPANNVNFTTGPGTDGWIGFYLKTSSAGWNVQLYIEPGSTNPATGSNGGIPQTVVADGQWHLYEWNLDDNTGDATGWGTISGILTGVATVGDGNHSIDSIVFRTNSAATPATSTFNLDFLALNSTGTVDQLLPEPATVALASLALLIPGRRRRR